MYEGIGGYNCNNVIFPVDDYSSAQEYGVEQCMCLALDELTFQGDMLSNTFQREM